MPSDDTIGAILGTAIFLLPLITLNKWLPFLYDCQYSWEGIDVVILGGSVRLFRIWGRNIREVSIVSVFKGPPWPATFWRCGVGNRLTTRCLWIRTSGDKSYVLTPANPEAALKALGYHAKPHSSRSKRRRR